MTRTMLITVLISLLSCNEKPKEYYPVQSCILEDLRKLDSLPLVITHIKTQSNLNDTSLARVEELRKLTLDLLNINWDQKNNRDNYEEFVISDPSSNNTSFVYSVKQSVNTPIQKIQINFKPEITMPKSLYAERIDISGEITIMRKILWTKETCFTVTSSYYQNGALLETIVDQFNWGFN